MSSPTKFLFLIPNTRWFGKRYWLWFNPAVLILEPLLRDIGVDVKVIESNIDNLSSEEIKIQIKDYQPDFVGITNLSLEYWKQAHYCAELVKEVDSQIITIMGGVHATVLPEKVMEDINFDYLILGEGEKRLPEFLKYYWEGKNFEDFDGIAYRERGAGKLIVNSPQEWFKDLDSIPFPDYKSYDWKKVMHATQKSAVGLGSKRRPVASLMTSRGCRFKCCFCAGHLCSGRELRFRSPENILQEIDYLVEEYGVREVIFTDDEMYADRERCVAIFNGLLERNYDLIWKNLNLAAWRMDYGLMKLMKESGCYQMTISPESGSDRVLKEIIHKAGTKQQCLDVAKWCRELDIEIDADFVIGFPGETWKEILETVAFAEELNVDAVKFAVATPFPGTELFQKAVEGGYLPVDYNFYRDEALGFAKGVISTEEFTPEQLHDLRAREWDRINFKTLDKRKKYAEMNGLTLEELEQFREETRKSRGVYYIDQVKEERGDLDINPSSN